jgi:hypothetical protein
VTRKMLKWENHQIVSLKDSFSERVYAEKLVKLRSQDRNVIMISPNLC